jgi:hypothetical protein
MEYYEDFEKIIEWTKLMNKIKTQILDLASPKNWIEDYPHENGNYVNKCIQCGEFFLGHKRRVICRECQTS